jgi:DNA-3-methyladenine glycosylase II
MPELITTSLRQRERALAESCPVMARLVKAVGPCTWELRADLPPFQTLARAIAHQQLNGIAAETIFSRFKALYAPAPFPEPAQLLATPEATLRATGLSFAKITALRDLAGKVASGVVPTTAEMHALEDGAIIERITQVRGIGRWTVEMLLMFQLGRPDVLPIDDFGVCNGFRLAYGLKGMPRPRALAEFGARWAPQRSLAAWYLWRAVDLHRDEKLPQAGRPPRVALRVKRAKAAAKGRRARKSAARKSTAHKATARKVASRKAASRMAVKGRRPGTSRRRR